MLPNSLRLRSHVSCVHGIHTPPLAAPLRLGHHPRQPQQPQPQPQQPQPHSQQPQPPRLPPQLPEPRPPRSQSPQPQPQRFPLATPLAHTDYLTFHQTRRRLLQRHAPRSPHGSRQRAAASSGGAQQPLARLLRVDMADAAATTEASGAGSAISSIHTGFPLASDPGNPRVADLVRLNRLFLRLCS